MTDIQNGPSQSLKNASVLIFINSFISAYDSILLLDSTTQSLAAEFHQKWPLLDQK